MKRLDLVALDHVLSEPTLTEEESWQLSRIGMVLQEIEERLDRHDDILARQGEQISELGAMITPELKGLGPNVFLARPDPLIQVLPLLPKLSMREHTVARLTDQILSRTWTAITGPSGCGKTQLAALVAHALGNCRAWVRLAGFRGDEIASVAVLEASLAKAGECAIESLPDGYDRMVDALGSGTLVVLDDMPRISAGSELGERLKQLFLACSNAGVKLLSTSPHPLPTNLMELFGPGIAHVPAPLLTDMEAAEVLEAYGAPKALAHGAGAMVNTICQGYPSLLVAAARYLSAKSWKIAESGLTGLIQQEHAQPIMHETIRRIIETVPEQESRDLLERMNLIVGQFAHHEVKVVAEVSPQIDRPLDRLDPVLGLWVQTEGEGWYTVSPLVRALGAVNLPDHVCRQVQFSLGCSILERRRLNQLDAAAAITYFASAKTWDYAGHVLIMALLAMKSEGIPSYDAGLRLLWKDTSLPGDMALGFRITIRSLQFSLARELGERAEFYLSEVSSLAGQASGSLPDRLALLMASVNVANAVAKEQPMAACQHLSKVFQLLPELDEVLTEPVTSSGLCIESMIWFVPHGLRNREDLDAWLSMVEAMAPEQRTRAFGDDLAEDLCLVVADRLWLLEAKKAEGEQNWDAVLAALEDLASRAATLSQELLWACAVRVRVVVHGEHRDDLPRAVAEGEQALRTASQDPRVQFLIRDIVGRQFAYARDNEAAAEWLTAALNRSTEAYPPIRYRTLLHAAVAVGAADARKATALTDRAVELGKSVELIPELELVRGYSESAIAKWQNSDMKGAFLALENAVSRLLDCKDDSVQWKSLFMTLGHVSGYLSSIAATGRPPDYLANGEPYTAPSRGFFLADKPKAAELYAPERDSCILYQLAQFADAVGFEGSAQHWAFKGIEMARAANFHMTVDALSLQVIPYLISADMLVEAIDLSLEAAAITVAAGKKHAAGEDVMMADWDVAGVLGEKPNGEWTSAERSSVIFGLFPAAIRLMTMALDDAEEARERAAQVAEICREISETASESRIWSGAADLIDKSFAEETNGLELHKYSNQFDNDTYGWLRMIGYSAATLKRDFLLPEAVKSHVLIFQPAWQQLRSLSPGTYGKVLVPFVEKFWAKKFDSARFQFYRPTAVEHLLADARQQDESKRVQAILRATGDGLGVTFSREVRKWLCSS